MELREEGWSLGKKHGAQGGRMELRKEAWSLGKKDGI